MSNDIVRFELTTTRLLSYSYTCCMKLYQVTERVWFYTLFAKVFTFISGMSSYYLKSPTRFGDYRDSGAFVFCITAIIIHFLFLYYICCFVTFVFYISTLFNNSWFIASSNNSEDVFILLVRNDTTDAEYPLK